MNIVFSHANSFPASTYRVLFKELRSRGLGVKAVEKFGHNPRYPISNNWPHIAQELLDFVEGVVQQLGEPVWLAGHSLGGFLSLMVAARNPALTRGVVLVDSPVIGGWRSTALGVMKTTQMFGSLSPGAISRRRRNTWPTVQAAYDHFRHKKAFAKWEDAVLQDYVEHGTHEVDGKRVLSFDRDIETQFYNALPDNLEQLLARHPIKCPVSYIGGLASTEMRQFGMAATERITQGRILMLDGSHLFPMENPRATAAAIEAALLNMTPKARK